MSDDSENWGLQVFGVADSLEISLNERIDRDQWELEIVDGQTTISFLIDFPEVAAGFLRFLKANYGKTKMRTATGGRTRIASRYPAFL